MGKRYRPRDAALMRTVLETALRFGDFGSFLLLHRGGFAGELEARAWRVVLDIVGEIPRAGQRLAGVVALAAGGEQGGGGDDSSGKPSPQGGRRPGAKGVFSWVSHGSVHPAVTDSDEKSPSGQRSPRGTIVIVLPTGKGLQKG